MTIPWCVVSALWNGCATWGLYGSTSLCGYDVIMSPDVDDNMLHVSEKVPDFNARNQEVTCKDDDEPN